MRRACGVVLAASGLFAVGCSDEATLGQNPAGPASATRPAGEWADAAAAQKEVEACLERYDYRVAERTLDAALATNPTSEPLLRQRVTLWRDCLEDSQKSAKALTDLLAAKPADAPALNDRGYMYFKLGRYDDALKDLDQALTLDPTMGVALGNRANVRFIKGDLDGAVRDLLKKAEVLPEWKEGVLGGRPDEELEGSLRQYFRLCKQSLEAPPSDAAAAAIRINELYKMGAYALAYREVKTLALGEASRNAELIFLAAFMADDLGSSEDAERLMTQYVELEPAASNGFNTRGFIRAKLGRFDDAHADLTRAIELDPRHAKAYMNRAWVRWTRGDDGAGEDATRAHELFNCFPEEERKR